MRIGIEYTSAVTQGAGIGRLTRGLVHALERLDRKNSYVLATARDPRNSQIGLLASNFELREVPFRERVSTIAWHRLGLPVSIERFIGKVDLFHATNFVLPPLRQARAITTIHDLSYHYYPQTATKGLLSFLDKVVPASIARSDLIVADSQSTARDVMDVYGVPADRLRVVYGAVDERFKPDTDRLHREEVALRYGIDQPALLAVGTVQPRKNLAALIEAYVLLREAGLRHNLYIAGASGWLNTDIYRRIEDLGLQPWVKFLGFVRDEDLPTVYSLANVFVYPSLYEGFGFPVLEAMACGTVVVCSNVSSIPEVGGDAVVYCDPADVTSIAAAIDRAVGDDALRDDLVKRGKERAALFTWANAGRALLSVYQELGAEV